MANRESLNETLSQILLLSSSDKDRYFISEGVLLENPNQAIKYLKSINLNPDTTEKGKQIITKINNITRGDGFTALLTKFHINNNANFDDLGKIHDYLKTNKQHLNNLKKPVVSYEDYEELKRDISVIEDNRVMKKFYNELPAEFKNDYNKLSDDEYEQLKKLVVDFNSFDSKQKEMFFEKVKSFNNFKEYRENLENVVNTIKDGLDFSSIVKKIQNEKDADIVYTRENNLVIAHIKSFEASKKLGCVAKWCISSRLVNYDSYRKGGKFYYFIWNYNYDYTSPNFLVATAYNISNPFGSETFNMPNKKVSFNSVLSDIDVDVDVFNGYTTKVKELIRKSLDVDGSIIKDIIDLPTSNRERVNEVLTDIDSSEFMQNIGGDSSFRYGNIDLGIRSSELYEYFDVDEYSVDSIYIYADGYGDGDRGRDELEYMKYQLDDNTLENFNKLKSMLTDEKYDFDEDGVMHNFIEQYNLDKISDIFLNEYNDAYSVAQQNKAKEIVNSIPLNLKDGVIDIDVIPEWLTENDISAQEITTFDDLISTISKYIPDFSTELENMYDISIDNTRINSEINDAINEYIENIDDVLVDVYGSENVDYKFDDITKLLKKLGFRDSTRVNTRYKRELDDRVVYLGNITYDEGKAKLFMYIEYKDTDKKPLSGYISPDSLASYMFQYRLDLDENKNSINKQLNRSWARN